MACPRPRPWLGLVYADFPGPYHGSISGTTRVVSEKRRPGGQGRYGAGGNLAGFVRPSKNGEDSRTVSTRWPAGGHVHGRFECVSADRLTLCRVLSWPTAKN